MATLLETPVNAAWSSKTKARAWQVLSGVLDFENEVRQYSASPMDAKKEALKRFVLEAAESARQTGLDKPKDRSQMLALWGHISRAMYSKFRVGSNIDLLTDAMDEHPPRVDCYASALVQAAVFYELGIPCKLEDLASHVMLRVDAPQGPLYLETLADYHYDPNKSELGHYYYTSLDQMWHANHDTLLSEMEFGPGLLNYPFMRVNRAEAYFHQGDVRNGLADLNAAIAMQPNYPFAYYCRALHVESPAGQDARAIADYSRAIELYPYRWEFYDARATVYERMGMLGEMRQDDEMVHRLRTGR